MVDHKDWPALGTQMPTAAVLGLHHCMLALEQSLQASLVPCLCTHMSDVLALVPG
jgi:hypothetical protein